MLADYDVIIGGAGIAGSLAAREVAGAGFSVLVLEEDLEVGNPEHCGGVVASSALLQLGLVPKIHTYVKRALIHSSSGKTAEVDARAQRVLVVDRRELDREAARMAGQSGAQIETGRRVIGVEEGDSLVNVKSNKGSSSARYYLDATGASSIITSRKSSLQSAQFDVYGSWFQHDAVELFFDVEAAPGFFSWIIPLGKGAAKVGVAGEGINTFKALEDFLREKRSVVLKKHAAPVVVSGPIGSFVQGKVIKAGDAAGQAKPTTAGGIFSGGMGGLLAGRALCEALSSGDDSKLSAYEDGWMAIFGREFRRMLLVRRLLSKLRNRDIDVLVSEASSSGILKQVSGSVDFDFHSTGLIRLLGMKRVASILWDAASTELRSLLSKDSQ